MYSNWSRLSQQNTLSHSSSPKSKISFAVTAVCGFSNETEIVDTQQWLRRKDYQMNIIDIVSYVSPKIRWRFIQIVPKE